MMKSEKNKLIKKKKNKLKTTRFICQTELTRLSVKPMIHVMRVS